MSQSGEHALELDEHPTDPCPPPSGPESNRDTWPRIPAVRLDLTTDILDNGDGDAVASHGD